MAPLSSALRIACSIQLLRHEAGAVYTSLLARRARHCPAWVSIIALGVAPYRAHGPYAYLGLSFEVNMDISFPVLTAGVKEFLAHHGATEVKILKVLREHLV